MPWLVGFVKLKYDTEDGLENERKLNKIDGRQCLRGGEKGNTRS